MKPEAQESVVWVCPTVPQNFVAAHCVQSAAFCKLKVLLKVPAGQGVG
jgi:hypothetical protein